MTEWAKDDGGLPPVVLLPAVQHTGSRFVRWDILKRYQHCQLNEAPLRRTVYYEHLSADRKCERFRALLGKYPAIVPLRHPRRVFKSWQKRAQNLKTCVEEWTNLLEMVDPHNPYYLPIDAPDRQAYLDVINRDLGLNIVTDWTPRGNKIGTMKMNPADIVLPDEYEQFLADIQPFISRFWSDVVDTPEITGVLFRNRLRRKIEAYGIGWAPKGTEGDTQKISNSILIDKFRLYDTLEVVEIEREENPEPADALAEAIKNGFKVDKRWGQDRLEKELRLWHTQQPS